MTFAALTPLILGLAAGATALGVLIFYLLRRTPRPQLVSNVAFWMRAAQSSRPKFLRASRIPWIAFLVSLLIALLMVAELGDPRFGRGVRGTTVIVLQAGRSMGATFQEQRRIDRAVREVRRWVERTTVGGQVAVVRAGMRPETLLPLTDDPADLDRALGEFDLDDGAADLAGALDLADRIVEESGGAGQILLVADHDVEHETRSLRVTIPVGVPGDTLAISGFSARRDPGAAGEYVVHCQVRAFTSRRSRARLRIFDGDVPLLDRRIELRPSEEVLFQAQGFSSARAELHARLEEIEISGAEDALELDDTADAVVEPLAPLQVLFVSEGNRWLEAALAVHPNADVTAIAPGALGGQDDDALARYDVLVLDRVALPEGRRHPAVVSFSPPAGELRVAGRAEEPRLTAALASHPALEGVRLDGIVIGRSHRFATEAGDQVLLRSGADALAVARERDERRTVAYGIALSATDLVQREAFPLMIHNTLHWAASVHDAIPLPRRLGEPLLAADDQTVLDPDGEAVSARELAEIRHAGMYHLGERAVPFSATEHAASLSAGATGGRFRNADPLPPLGILVALALLALITLEWALLHRGRLE